MNVIDYAAIEAALEPHGLRARGGFHTLAYDNLDGETVVMVGHAGPAMFAAFVAARGGEAHPLDAWTRRVIGGEAAHLGARPIYPFEPPLRPFQRWGRRAEAIHPTPIGFMIHPDWGLWHGWRGALLFRQRLDLPPRVERPSPCDTCAGKPCLTACPVGAFSASGFDAAACRAHVNGPGAACRDFGCRARHACPVGRDHAYRPDQAAFHMSAYARDLRVY